jgi:hypothetical protein
MFDTQQHFNCLGNWFKHKLFEASASGTQGCQMSTLGRVWDPISSIFRYGLTVAKVKPTNQFKLLQFTRSLFSFPYFSFFELLITTLVQHCLFLAKKKYQWRHLYFDLHQQQDTSIGKSEKNNFLLVCERETGIPI